jgi:hypothetical protein
MAALRQYFFIKDTVLFFQNDLTEPKWPYKSSFIKESILTIEVLGDVDLTAHYLLQY